MRKLKQFWSRALLRPIVYMVFTRMILACLAMGVWQNLVNQDGDWSVLMIVPPALSAIFFMLAWFIFLRFDGLHLPRFFRRKRKMRAQKRHRGDLLDDVDEDTYTFEELTQDEDDCCAFVANLTCALIFLVISLLACL